MNLHIIYACILYAIFVKKKVNVTQVDLADVECFGETVLIIFGNHRLEENYHMNILSPYTVKCHMYL